MKLRLNAAVVASIALMAMGSASATIVRPSSLSLGNSELLLVVHSASAQQTLIVDLGLRLSDFLPGTGFAAEGANTLTWNFNSNAVTGFSSALSNDWTAAFNSFKAAAGTDFQWYVAAADAITGSTITASNAVVGRGYMLTGTPSAAEMTNANGTNSAPIGNAIGQFDQMVAASNNLGTHVTADNGAGIATSGTAYGGLGGNLTGFAAWNGFTANGASTRFTYLQQVVSNPVAYQIGSPVGQDQPSSNPGLFTFDINADTLTWTAPAAPIPEPGTYALFAAGLATLGFLSRRRKV